jgi:DNA-binding protein YbaB
MTAFRCRAASTTMGSMFDGQDLDEAERMIDRWQAGFDERAARARAMSARLMALTAAAESDDGLVQVTVGASGSITGLDLQESVRDRPAAETAKAILSTLRAAQAALTEAATAVAAETIGAGSETGKAVIASYAARESAGDE